MEISAIGQKINTLVRQSQNILVIAHQQPDADCLGSLMALSDWFKLLGKKHTKFCIDQPPDNLGWLVNFEPVESDPEWVIKQNYDLVIVVDSGDLKYAGVDSMLPQLLGQPTVINIDHHATNQNFGQLNLVDQTAVSTSVILYELFRNLGVEISRPAASALLAGIIFDTYNFTNPNTNQRSLEVAARLLSAGASLPQVSDSILKTKTVESLKVWGKILLRLTYNPKFSVATTVITAEDLHDSVTPTEVTEGVANFLNNLTGVKAALILQQQGNGIIKGSLRTNDDLIDVAKLARMLGGGGHKKASGFKIKGKLVEDNQGNWKIV